MFNPHWMRISIQPSTWINDFMRVDLTLIAYILSRVFHGKSREEQEMQEIETEFNHSYVKHSSVFFKDKYPE